MAGAAVWRGIGAEVEVEVVIASIVFISNSVNASSLGRHCWSGTDHLHEAYLANRHCFAEWRHDSFTLRAVPQYSISATLPYSVRKVNGLKQWISIFFRHWKILLQLHNSGHDAHALYAWARCAVCGKQSNSKRKTVPAPTPLALNPNSKNR